MFLPHVPEDRRARVEAVPDLDAALASLAAAGRAAWPEIRVDDADLLAFLGRCVPDDAAQLPALRAGELYLVCAYALSVPGASEALEAHYMPRVQVALKRIGTQAIVMADVQQELRRRLVEPDRKGYAGRGDLAAWLCVSAVREAGRRRERGKRERPLGEADVEVMVSPEADPEMAHLRTTYEEEFGAAFARALASLTTRQRNMLYYHLIERRSIDQIGALYGTHRATAARWINDAREALRERTRELLAERVSLSDAGFQRLLSLIAARIDVGAALGAAPV